MRPSDCQRCPELVKSRHCVIDGRGAPNARIMLIGLGPGVEEDEAGKCFVGPSGQLLRLLADAAGIPLIGLYLANAIGCHPAGNRRPTAKEIKACREYVLEEIQAVNPLVIVTLGDVALHSVYGQTVPISAVLGQTLTQPETGIPFVPTYHPAYLLRGQWQAADLVIPHMEKARRIAAGEQPQESLGHYQTVTTLAELYRLRERLVSQHVEQLAWDTETTGLDWRTDEILCISFSTKPGEGFVVPLLSHPDESTPVIPHWTLEEWPEVISILRDIFGTGIPKRGQNQLFDLRFMERRSDWPIVTAATAFGIEVNGRLEDTMLLHHAVAENLPHHLTGLISLYSGMPYYEEEVAPYKKHMEKAPNAVVWPYSAADADALNRVAPPLRAKAAEEGSLWASETVIQPLIRCCWELEKRGVLVDREWFDKLCAHFKTQQEDLEQRLYEIPIPNTEPGWKYTYAKELQRVLFKELKLPASGRKTDKSKGCEDCAAGLCFEHDQTGKDALLEVAEKSDHPILPILLELKKVYKLRSTYLDGGKNHGFLRHIAADGRIHCQYRVGVAETSRLSSADPNMQNIPGEFDPPVLDEPFPLRCILIAPEGKGLMEADWSQLEVWGLAYRLAKLFGDTTLLDVLLSGRDIHVFAARNIWPVDPELSDGEWRGQHGDLRTKAKPVVFGTNYGLTQEGLAARLHTDSDTAAAIIATYKEIVPGLKQYFPYVRQCMEEDGRVPNEFDQFRHFPEMALIKAAGRGWDIEGLLREGVNFPIQSGGSLLHSYVSRLSTESNVLHRRGAFPVQSVHDSLNFEFDWPDHDYAVNTAWIIKEMWEMAAKTMVKADGTPLGWQIPVELKWGRSWGHPLWKLTAQGEVKEIEY